MQCLLDTANESELPSQAVRVFPWSSKKHAVLPHPDGGLCVFCWLIPDAFQGVMLSVCLIGSVGINCLVFWKELKIEDSCPIPPYSQRCHLWMKTCLWCGWRWFPWLVPWSLPFYIIVQYALFITCQNLFLKWCILCYVSTENHVQKFCQGGFFSLMWKSNIKVINIQSWCKWFSAILWVCWLSPVWCDFDCSQWMSQFDVYQLQLVSLDLGASPSKKSLAQDIANHFLTWFDQS